MLSTLLIIFAVSYLAFGLSAICGGGAGLVLLPGINLPSCFLIMASPVKTSYSSSALGRFKKLFRYVCSPFPQAAEGIDVRSSQSKTAIGFAIGPNECKITGVALPFNQY